MIIQVVSVRLDHDTIEFIDMLVEMSIFGSRNWSRIRPVTEDVEKLFV